MGHESLSTTARYTRPQSNQRGIEISRAACSTRAAAAPQSNQRGIEILTAINNVADSIRSLNRTSVGLKSE